MHSSLYSFSPCYPPGKTKPRRHRGHFFCFCGCWSCIAPLLQQAVSCTSSSSSSSWSCSCCSFLLHLATTTRGSRSVNAPWFIIVAVYFHFYLFFSLPWSSEDGGLWSGCLSLSRRIQPSNPPEYSSTYYAYIIFPALGFVALCLYSLFLCYVLCPVSPRRLFIAYVYTSFSFVFFSRAIISVWKKKVLAGLRELRLREETFRLYSTNHGLQRQMLQQISSK